jgi:hypothetical protein
MPGNTDGQATVAKEKEKRIRLLILTVLIWLWVEIKAKGSQHMLNMFSAPCLRMNSNSSGSRCNAAN